MNNVNVNKNDTIKLIKNFIKDLSFENTQNINNNDFFNNNNSNINVDMNVIFTIILTWIFIIIID